MMDFSVGDTKCFEGQTRKQSVTSLWSLQYLTPNARCILDFAFRKGGSDDWQLWGQIYKANIEIQSELNVGYSELNYCGQGMSCLQNLFTMDNQRNFQCIVII